MLLKVWNNFAASSTFYIVSTTHPLFPTGKSLTIFSEHKGFVQGVAWDPKNQFVATLCSDRSCRVFSLKTKKVIQKTHQVRQTFNILAYRKL